MTLGHLYKRLTPAHIGLCGWQPKFEKAEIENAEIENTKSKTIGERVVASKGLTQGKVILKEEPFICQINNKYQTTHCSFCLSLLKKTKEACQNKYCQWKHFYCSMTCSQKHWSAEHKWFCNFPEIMDTDKDVTFAFQGYIASRSIGNYTLPGLVSNLDSHKPEEIEEYRKKIENSKLKNVFHLNDGVIESMIVILAQIRCNTFAVKHLVSFKSKEVEERENITVGRAVYLSASKFNHSCDPNALVLFGMYGIGSHMKILLVGDEVEKGTEINISYGPLSTRVPKKERKEKLRNDYFFDCNCSTCQMDYDPSLSIYKCLGCRTGGLVRFQDTCKNCGFRSNWITIIKSEEAVQKMQEKAQHEADIDLFEKTLERLNLIYVEHSLPIGQWFDAVGAMYARKRDFFSSSKYVKQSIAIVQRIFGRVSVEVAEEMTKLTGILKEGYQLHECFHTAMETLSLYRTLGLDKSYIDDFEYLKTVVSLTQYSSDKSLYEN